MFLNIEFCAQAWLMPGQARGICKVLQLPAPGKNVIAGACTLNMAGQAQGKMWSPGGIRDRRGVHVIAVASGRLDWTKMGST